MPFTEAALQMQCSLPTARSMSYRVVTLRLQGFGIFDTCILLTQICFSTALDADSHAFGWAGVTKATGGEMSIQDSSVDLRILIDHSAVEVFTGCGQALTTR